MLIRLEIRSPAEAAATCRLALRHAAARQPVNCFVASGAAHEVAFRLLPEQVGTRVICPNFRRTGNFTAVGRLQGAVNDAMAALGEDATRPEIDRQR